jgi:hypothetical protein
LPNHRQYDGPEENRPDTDDDTRDRAEFDEIL